MKKYYLHDGANQLGPFDIDDLKIKKLNASTPVWFEGLSQWTTIGNVTELQDIIAATPPPFSAQMPAPPSMTPTSKTSPKNRSNPTSSRLLVLIGIIVLVITGVYIYNRLQEEKYQSVRQMSVNAEEDRKALVKSHITSLVTAERSSYTFSGLGGISNLSITVNNNTDYIIDNVKVRVIYLKPNGEVWNSRFVDFNLLNPQTKNTIKVPDTERGVRVNYEIVSIRSNALALN